MFPPGSLALLVVSLAGWFLLVNSLTFTAFYVDKRRAVAGEWRVPERTLLLLATIGGWPAAKAAQLTLRHKTRKQPFRALLNLSILPLAGLIGMFAAQDVNWQAVTDRFTLPAAAESAGPVATPATPAKPTVINLTKSATPTQSAITANPDLPKRIGPGTSKGAWQAH